MSSLIDACAEFEAEMYSSSTTNMDDWSIEIHKIDQADDMLTRVLEHCWGVTDSKMTKKRLFEINDSILEIPEYYAFCVAPRSVAMQMETHKKKHRFYAVLSFWFPFTQLEWNNCFAVVIEFAMRTLRAPVRVTHRSYASVNTQRRERATCLPYALF
jgi:hypothetical protein